MKYKMYIFQFHIMFRKPERDKEGHEKKKEIESKENEMKCGGDDGRMV